MVDLARESRAQVSANQQSLLVESYYGLRLAQQIVTVREETYNGLKKHYENALKLEAAGMIDKAGRLFAQVNMDEAKRALEAARKEETVVQSALKVLLNKKDADANIIPTSPLFMNDSLPPKMLFDLSVNSGNYTLNQLQLQQHIAKWDACQESNCCSHNSQHQIFYKIKASYLKVRNSDGFHDTDFPVFFCHRKSNRKF